MAFIEIMNLKQRNEFCCQVVMGVNPHPAIFSKDNILGGCDVKVYFMLFHFIFYNFVERVMELKLTKDKRDSIFYGMAMVSSASSQFGIPTSMIGESMYW